jgi:predicted site-specific integrase-resolvase
MPMPRKTSAPLKVPPSSDLVKKPVAAAFLGVTPRTLENWRNRGFIPYVRIANRIIRYSLTDIATALRKNGLVEAIKRENK